MQGLKIINEISDETFNDFLKRFSFRTKRFMAQVRKELKEKDIVLTTSALKNSFIQIGDIENTDDPMLVFLKENEDKFNQEIHRFFNEMPSHFYHLNALVQTTLKNKAAKKEYFENLYEKLERNLIESGFTFFSTEYTQQFQKQLLELRQSNLTPEKVLQPNDLASIIFLQDMVNKLANVDYISKEFKKEETQTYWLHRAFNVHFYFECQLENFQLKINWNNLNNLADWLLFLKKSCIVYDYKDNKQLLDWVIEHVSYKGQEFSKGAKNYKSLVRAIKFRKKYIGYYFMIDKNNMLKIK